MIKEGPHTKNRESPNRQPPTKSTLSLRPSLCTHKLLSFSTTWEPGVFRQIFLHLKVPSPHTCCILFTPDCTKMIKMGLLCSPFPPTTITSISTPLASAKRDVLQLGKCWLGLQWDLGLTQCRHHSCTEVAQAPSHSGSGDVAYPIAKTKALQGASQTAVPYLPVSS